eukprot:1185598-Prorocentrum_minimum.AAC.5
MAYFRLSSGIFPLTANSPPLTANSPPLTANSPPLTANSPPPTATSTDRIEFAHFPGAVLPGVGQIPAASARGDPYPGHLLGGARAAGVRDPADAALRQHDHRRHLAHVALPARVPAEAGGDHFCEHGGAAVAAAAQVGVGGREASRGGGAENKWALKVK